MTQGLDVALVRGPAASGWGTGTATGIAGYADALEAGLGRLGVRVHDVRLRKHELRLGGRGRFGDLSLEWSRRTARLPAGSVVHAPHLDVFHHRAHVLTLHDLAWKRWPDQYPSTWHAYAWGRRALRRVRAVLTPSEHVRRQVVAELGFAPDLVHATPLAPRDVFLQAGQPAPRPTAPTFAFVGEVRPRKQLHLVLEALRDPRLRGMRLVRAGPPWRGDAYGTACRSLVERHGLAVEDVGYRTGAELAQLYADCAALVYPSLDEGFGLPPLEAAACGTGSVLTPLPVFDETVGPLRYGARDMTVQALADAMVEARDTPIPPRALRDRAAHFSWDRCAAQTAAVYEACAGFRPA